MADPHEGPDRRPAHGALIPKPPGVEDAKDVGRQQAMLDDEWAPARSANDETVAPPS